MVTDLRPLAPIITLTAVAVGVMLVDLLVTRRRTPFLGWLTAAGALAALAIDWIPHGQVQMWDGLIRFDVLSRAFNTVFLVALAVIAIGSVSTERRLSFAGEYYGLLAFSTIGLMLMGSAGGLLLLYAGLELSTIALFALVGFARREQRSAEAALKMFVLGAVASAVFLYGASILYGVLGSTQYDAWGGGTAGASHIALDAHAGPLWAVWLGAAFVIAALGFKISAAPFHAWAPDVYEGAPATVTAYLATASKAGAFAALLRFLVSAAGPLADHWLPAVVGIAALSMVLGNVIALVQTNLKRLLAYSGVAQAGYILVAVAGARGTDTDLVTGSVVMYLLLYAFTNIAGFLVAQAILDATGSDDIVALRGLHRRSPLLAFSMLVVLFSLGGIPPLAGFVGKLYLFAAGWQGGQYALVLVGALTSVIALYYYLMVALQVYIRDPSEDTRVRVAPTAGLAIGLCVAATIAIGVYPRPLVLLGNGAASAIRHSVPLPGAGDVTRGQRTSPVSTTSP